MAEGVQRVELAHHHLQPAGRRVEVELAEAAQLLAIVEPLLGLLARTRATRSKSLRQITASSLPTISSPRPFSTSSK